MKKIFFLLPLVALCSALTAQTRVVGERQDKSMVFVVENKTYAGAETIELELKAVTNSNATLGVSRFIVRTNGVLPLMLRPIDGTNYSSCKYTYRVVRGIIDPKVDTTFVYGMPCSPSKPVRVFQGVHVLDKYTKAKADQRRLGTHFYMQRGDTVCAMRRGVVTEVKHPEKSGSEVSKVSFTSNAASLVVEHPDGTYARYICLDEDSFLVREGDQVLPGTPLALAGSYDGEQYEVSIQLYWIQTNPDAAAREKMPYAWRYFFPPLATTDGAVVVEHGRTYTPLVGRELITREMTRKELKKWDAAKK